MEVFLLWLLELHGFFMACVVCSCITAVSHGQVQGSFIHLALIAGCNEAIRSW